MLVMFFIFIYPVLFLGANGQDLTCSTTWGNSCPSVIPLVDGPTCPEGFDLVEKYCFKVSDEKVYWEESKHICEEMNAKLAEPKELSQNLFDTANTAFAIYLWNHIDERFHYDDLYFHERLFSIGGQFNNNTWDWLTGGFITDHLDGINETECMSIIVYSEDVASETYAYYLSIPCDMGMSLPMSVDDVDEWIPFTFRYVCQAELVDNNYGICEHYGIEYPSGKLLSTNKEQCQQIWCQDGSFTQNTCGINTTGCCFHNDILYGNGDFIGPEVHTENCSGCQQEVCQDGVIQWHACENCATMCCFFNKVPYHPGSHIQNACARMVCNGATGEFDFFGIDSKCPQCKAYLDPHIVTYDQMWSSYNYQKCGNYSLSQIGSSYQPIVAVYATFVPCGGSWDVTCVDTVTFKNLEHTVIVVGFKDDEFKLQVNGADFNIISSDPGNVEVNGTVYPVLACKSDNCVHLQGCSGILVTFCGSSWANEVYVWANPDLAIGLKGLCGTFNDDVEDDFTTRDGNIMSPWKRDPPEEFPLSWLASDTSNGSCDGINVNRIIMQTLNKCDSNYTVLETINEQCYNTITDVDPNGEPEELQTIFDDCVYDLCNVTDPDEWLRAVRVTAENQAFIQVNTLSFATPAPPTVDCKCKFNCWKRSGYCTKDPASCDGQVRKRGCRGAGCACCIPQGCRPKMKCRRKGGFCISDNAICDGEIRPFCQSPDCDCCLEEGRCKPKDKCLRKGGVCVTDPSTCTGTIKRNGCRRRRQSGKCYCCINKPKC